MNADGFSFIEVLTALLILSLVAVVAGQTVFSVTRVEQRGQHMRSQAGLWMTLTTQHHIGDLSPSPLPPTVQAETEAAEPILESMRPAWWTIYAYPHPRTRLHVRLPIGATPLIGGGE